MDKFSVAYSYNILFNHNNEARIHTKMWINLKNTMLSEKSNKHSYSVGKYLHEIFRIGKSIRTEIESVNAKDWKED